MGLFLRAGSDRVPATGTQGTAGPGRPFVRRSSTAQGAMRVRVSIVARGQRRPRRHLLWGPRRERDRGGRAGGGGDPGVPSLPLPPQPTWGRELKSWAPWTPESSQSESKRGQDGGGEKTPRVLVAPCKGNPGRHLGGGQAGGCTGGGRGGGAEPARGGGGGRRPRGH